MSARTRSLAFLPGFLLPGVLMAQSAPTPLTDADIAHVAVTANSIDVEMARLAEARTGNAEVRRFATTMVTDHSAVNAQAAALAGRLGVTPTDNAVSQSLRAGAATARAGIEKARGAAFDRMYMDREVAYHQAVLDALDQTLIPATHNAELKALLVKVRPAIATHLEHARMLQKSLGNAK